MEQSVFVGEKRSNSSWMSPVRCWREMKQQRSCYWQRKKFKMFIFTLNIFKWKLGLLSDCSDKIKTNHLHIGKLQTTTCEPLVVNLFSVLIFTIMGSHWGHSTASGIKIWALIEPLQRMDFLFLKVDLLSFSVTLFCCIAQLLLSFQHDIIL